MLFEGSTIIDLEKEMSRAAISGILSLLVLTSIWTLSSGVYPVRCEGSLILEIEVNKTAITIGETIDITLTLKNAGEDNVKITFGPPFFDVCYNTSEGLFHWSDGQCFIQVILDLILEPGENYTETLHWDLYQYIDQEFCPPKPGTYNLFGHAIWIGKVTESIPITVYSWNPADLNYDLEVNLYDAVLLLAVYGSKLGDEEYNCHCDIAEPYGQIDVYDAVLLLVNYGKKYS